MTLITNPQWELLGGPCTRCGDYYLKKAKRRKKYCKRDCSSAATAVPAMIQKRQKHAQKIHKTQISVDKWSEKKRRLPWKEWVSNQTGYTVKN